MIGDFCLPNPPMPAFASSSALDALRASGASLFGQHARLLRLRFAEDAGLGAEALLAHRLHGEEGLSQHYRYTLDCLSADSRYNELLFDDSTNEIRTKLSSEHGKTQLNQG